jgi:hypothetical protein
LATAHDEKLLPAPFSHLLTLPVPALALLSSFLEFLPRFPLVPAFRLLPSVNRAAATLQAMGLFLGLFHKSPTYPTILKKKKKKRIPIKPNILSPTIIALLEKKKKSPKLHKLGPTAINKERAKTHIIQSMKLKPNSYKIS